MQAGSLSVEKAEAKVAQEAPTFSRATPLQGVSVIAFGLGGGRPWLATQLFAARMLGTGQFGRYRPASCSNISSSGVLR